MISALIDVIECPLLLPPGVCTLLEQINIATSQRRREEIIPSKWMMTR